MEALWNGPFGCPGTTVNIPSFSPGSIPVRKGWAMVSKRNTGKCYELNLCPPEFLCRTWTLQSNIWRKSFRRWWGLRGVWWDGPFGEFVCSNELYKGQREGSHKPGSPHQIPRLSGTLVSAFQTSELWLKINVHCLSNPGSGVLFGQCMKKISNTPALLKSETI